MLQQPTTISAELRCPVCKKIYQHPYILCCGHTFCFSCIQNCILIMGWHCPLCHSPFNKNGMMRDQILMDTLEEGHVKCFFPNCGWKGPLRECRLHYNSCPYRKGLSELLTLNYISNKKGVSKRKWCISEASTKKYKGFEDCN